MLEKKESVSFRSAVNHASVVTHTHADMDSKKLDSGNYQKKKGARKLGVRAVSEGCVLEKLGEEVGDMFDYVQNTLNVCMTLILKELVKIIS